MNKFLLTGCATLILGMSSAFAADSSARATNDWSGLYGGGFVGYAFSGDDTVAVKGFGDVGDLSLSGIYGGVDLGFNHRIDNIVLGLEADIAFSGISDEDTNSGFKSENDLSYVGTLRARAGFVADQALFYATGGMAFTNSDYSVTNNVNVDIDDSLSRVGYAVGAGVEYAIDGAWSMKAEYMYMNFGADRASDGLASTKVTPDFHSVRLGLNYKF